MSKSAKRLPAGWTEGTVQELLGLTDEDAAVVEERMQEHGDCTPPTTDSREDC